MDWKRCLDSEIAKKITPDSEMVKALSSSSDNKLKSSEMLGISRITTSSKLSLTYDALREALEALAIKNGYKVYNHECYACFLKEVLRLDEEANEFDRLRKIRNKINYYGEELSVDEASVLIKKLIDLRKIIVRHLNAPGSP